MPAGTIGNVTGMERNRFRAEKRQPRATVQEPGRRLPSPRGGGRAWINGREVGGGDQRYVHLNASYD